MVFRHLWSKSNGLPPKKAQIVSRNWNIVSHTNKELPITVTVNILILTSSGQPNIEKGNKPEENHVSNTSSSATGKMAHQKRTDKHYQSCRVTFDPFTPYLYKQTKRRKNKSNGKIAWVETVLSLDLGPDESGRGTELPRGRKENLIPSPLLFLQFSQNFTVPCHPPRLSHFQFSAELIQLVSMYLVSEWSSPELHWIFLLPSLTLPLQSDH